MSGRDITTTLQRQEAVQRHYEARLAVKPNICATQCLCCSDCTQIKPWSNNIHISTSQAEAYAQKVQNELAMVRHELEMERAKSASSEELEQLRREVPATHPPL